MHYGTHFNLQNSYKVHVDSLQWHLPLSGAHHFLPWCACVDGQLQVPQQVHVLLLLPCVHGQREFLWQFDFSCSNPHHQ